MFDGLSLPGKEGTQTSVKGEKSSSSLVSVLFSLVSLVQTSTAIKSFIRERQKQIERAEQLRRIGDLTGARKALAAAAEINH